MQPDGKILFVIGSNWDALWTARLSIDDSLDTTFGSGSWVGVNSPLGPGGKFASVIALQLDGKVVIAGTVSGASGDFGVARLLGDIQPISIGGTIFDDLDNDGALDVGESGIAGVPVTLTGTDTNGGVNRTKVTLADGSYVFDDVLSGEYSITADQAAGLLDGKEMAGTLGGTVDNSQDSQTISGIVVANGDPDASGYNFAEIRPSEAIGLVWQDFNNDGEVNFGEQAIEGVTVNLSGFDDRGNAVSRAVETDVDGVYMFIDLRPGEYTISEVQPAGYNDGIDVVGTVNGDPVGTNSANDVISGVALALPGSVAANYNFGERPEAGGGVASGQTATIGFW